MQRRPIVLVLAASAVMFVGSAYAYPPMLPRQQTLLNRGCRLAATRIEGLLKRVSDRASRPGAAVAVDHPGGRAAFFRGRVSPAVRA